MNRRNSVIVLLALLLCSPFCYANEPVAISPYGAAIVMQRYQNCPYVMNRRQADFRYALDVVLDPAVDFDNYGFFVGTGECKIVCVKGLYKSTSILTY